MKTSGPIDQVHLILASVSPRRKDLLSSIGLRFSVEPARIVEDYQNGENPNDHVCRLALVKTGEVSSRFSSQWVLGADTVVVSGRRHTGQTRVGARGERHVEPFVGSHS